MATKSILKNVNIKGRKQTQRLVGALEHAQQHKGKNVAMNRTVSEAKGDEIVGLFANYF